MPEVEFVPAEVDPSYLQWVRELLAGVFAIDDITTGVMGRRTTRVRGRFLVEADSAYERLAPQFRERGRTLLFRRDGDRASILIVDGVIHPKPDKLWVPIVLAVATVLSVLFTYTILWSGIEPTLANIMGNLGGGLQFTVSLLSILVCHELGHYFTARHYGVAVSLPYLIPFPLNIFGTMGAVIRMKDVPPSRRAMLRIGAAGPIAGMIVALPIVILGLSLSEVVALPPGGGYMMEGNSLLYLGLKYLVFGRWLPMGNVDVLMHPIAFAGWAGMLVTFFNLIPAGQLDGGHVACAVLGPKARYLTWAIIGGLFLLGIWWQTWIIWAVIIFIFSRQQAVPLNDVSPLKRGDIVIAVILLFLLIVTLTPVPMRLVG